MKIATMTSMIGTNYIVVNIPDNIALTKVEDLVENARGETIVRRVSAEKLTFKALVMNQQAWLLNYDELIKEEKKDESKP